MTTHPLRATMLGLIAILLSASSVRVVEPASDGYEQMQARAEALYAEGSFSAAHRLYVEVAERDLSDSARRWVALRTADTSWRAQASTATEASTHFDEATRRLQGLIDAIQDPAPRDRVWAEAHESLADLAWQRPRSRNWGQAWTHYEQALDWWAGAVEIDLARDRYLEMVWKMARPQDVQPHYTYGYYGNTVPLAVLDNALRIARDGDDRARAHYLIAMTLRRSGAGMQQPRRVSAEFEAAIESGAGTAWYDDALYHYAEWLRDHGTVVITEDGQLRSRPDYVGALELFRRLTREHARGTTRYHDRALQEIRGITEPVVGVRVTSAFLPGSEVQYLINWRNVDTIDLALHRVDVSRDVSFLGSDVGAAAWLSRIELEGSRPIRSWSHRTQDAGDHRPGNETLRIEQPLAVGAYVLDARSGNTRSRELILVTDAALVLKTSGRRALAYVCDAVDGSPLAGADVTLWARHHDGGSWTWSRHSAVAGTDGLAVFELQRQPGGGDRHDLFAGGAAEGRQAFAIASAYRPGGSGQQWRIQAYTDRPAYRPGETVQWKMLGRTHDGAVYSTPTGQSVVYQVNDPRGATVDEGEIRLGAFGSGWGSLETKEAMPLGEYRVHFRTAEGGRGIGQAVLFRLEEYKLPEFRVSIETPREGEKKKTFRLGQTMEVEIDAEYYFGGPVVEASVEVLVYQRPYHHWWHPRREFPWFYQDMQPRPGYYGTGSLVDRQTLKTDADGRAVLRIETPAGNAQDLEYRIEARVTDASRREIVGTDRVRVTRHAYYVHPRPQHNLYRPQDEVTFLITTVDANEQGVAADGMVRVTRDHWHETWIGPDGNEVSGAALRRDRDRVGSEPGWTLKSSGYRHEEILSRGIRTGADGQAELRFVPQSEGFYRLRWVSREQDGIPVTAESTVWVASRETSELGHRHGGLEIIVDRDTMRAGQTAPVMLSTPTNDRWVLLSVEGEDLYSYRMVHVEGNVKLLQLEIDERHVPNVYLAGAMVSDASLFVDTEQVVVPPENNFLEVEVGYDRESYQPREPGVLTVTTRDHQGQPVSAEVSLGLVDESVYYIQQEYASDPRRFFYGTKRGLHVRTSSTFQQRHYARLVAGDESGLVDVGLDTTLRDLDEEEGRRDAFRHFAERGQAAGAMRSELAADAAASPAVVAEKKMETAQMSGGEASPAVEVRSDFRSTVLWRPDVVTDRNGRATVEVTFPDSLTGWLATARVAARDSRFGMATASTQTRKPLVARLQAPRFFVVGDWAVVSAVINNNTHESLRVTPSLALDGLVLVQGATNHEPVEVPAQGEVRVDWSVAARSAGPARITVTTRGGSHADAMQRDYRVHEHGIEKLIARSGKLRGDEVELTLDIPAARRPGSTRLEVQLAPSLAVTLLDALPYLADYPYGCTEQTMSRFLPATITARTLAELGMNAETVRKKMFGGIEPAHAAQTHSVDKGDLGRLDEMVDSGLARLHDFQHSDGGWGWWKRGESDHFMTAYVVWGLTLARDAGVRIDGSALERAVAFLNVELVEEEDRPDLQAWMLHALAVEHAQARRRSVQRFQAVALENLWSRRTELNAYSRALLALCAHAYGDTAKAATLVRNLENGVKIDRSPDTSVVQRGAARSHDAVVGTAHWGADGIYRRWSEGGVEATAFALRALLAIDPNNELIEPVTHWLIRNRRGAQWSNTRDTAIVVLALNDYLRVSGESNADVEYELLFNGKSVVRRRLDGDDALAAPSRVAIDPRWIRDGVNRVRIVRHGGDGPLYFSAEVGFFSLEEPVTPSGNEVFVRRQYHRMVGRETLLKGYVYDRRPLGDGGEVRSGERVEALITVETKNHLEYLVFEDLKPAGLEATRLRSGEPLVAREIESGAELRVHQELRDRKVALFLDRLPEGIWEIRYELRAETPGEFHALPVVGHAMYVPEIRGNGAEVRMTVLDR